MSTTLPPKADVRAVLRAELARLLEATAHAAAQSRAGAVHEDNRAEGDKDMRSTEQSYLARGQAMRAEELSEQLARFDQIEMPSFGPKSPIDVGALVLATVESASGSVENKVLFISALGAGSSLSVGNARVVVISPSSPVGALLIGRKLGDSFELTVAARGTQEWAIEAVA